ncbi:hypothetical protein ACWOFR_01435 [Carnobacterium gallinarum]|uniref:hypothetical protein n=1 Tax=Carnobacterium gallinarum TaxID=2749 RepID=UPI0005593BC0|nr:hypothetical protein [Carnobacterium gallinarum]
MNQKGAVLPSVILFLALTLVLVRGTTSIYQGQMRQFIVLNNYYQAKTLAIVATTELERKLKRQKQPPKKVTIVYNVGEVHLLWKNEKSYFVQVVLKNHYVSEEVYVVTEEVISETRVKD